MLFLLFNLILLLWQVLSRSVLLENIMLILHTPFLLYLAPLESVYRRCSLQIPLVQYANEQELNDIGFDIEIAKAIIGKIMDLSLEHFNSVSFHHYYITLCTIILLPIITCSISFYHFSGISLFYKSIWNISLFYKYISRIYKSIETS